MANPGAAAGGGYLAARYHTVFIDTSLDTHMAMVVGEADTVGDFKKKIKEEHALCFPDIGEIRINALQVKCRGFLYHLSDAMFVKNAFDGVKSKWFLYVDASQMVKHGLDICGHFARANGMLRCLEHKDLVDVSDELLNEPNKTVQEFPKDSLLNEKDIGNGTNDMFRKVLSDMETPFPRANGILRYLECKDLVDVSDELLNEPNKTVQEFPKDSLLNEKDIGNGTNDMFRKVLSDMVIELEQTGGDHCRTSSSDTNKKTPEAYESTFPDSEMKTSRRKRKADDTENDVDKDMPTGDVMDEHVKLSNSERKKRKIQKKEKKSSNGSKTKTNSSALVASGEGAQIDDAIQEKTVPINFTINSTVDMLCDTVSEGHEALNSVLSTDARQESGNEARYDVPKKTRRHLYSLNIGPSNELSNGAEAMHLEPVTEAVSPDHSHKSVSEDSLMRKVRKVRKHPGGSDIAAARSSDVLLEKNEHISKKMKKKKTKSHSHQIQLPPTALLPVEDDKSDKIEDTTGSQFADAFKKPTAKYLGVKNVEDPLQDPKMFSDDQTCPVKENELLKKHTEKMSLENQNPGDQGESKLFVEAHGVTPNFGVASRSNSCKKGRKAKKGSVETVVSDSVTNDISVDKSQKVVSSKLDVPMNGGSVGDQESGRTDALDGLPVPPIPKVPFENSYPSTKRKKNKTETSKQPSFKISLLEKSSDGDVVYDTVIQSAVVCKESDPNQFVVKEMEDVIQDHQSLATDLTTSVEGQRLEPMGTDKVSSESQKPADSNENITVAEVSEVFHQDVAMMQLKSGKKAKKERKGSASGSKKKTKMVNMGEETTKEEVLLNQNVANTEGLNVQVIKDREASSEAAQPKSDRNLESQVPTVEKENKKSKKKRSTDHSNNGDKSVEADDGDLVNYRLADGVNQSIHKFNQNHANAAPSSGTVTGTADVFQVEGKHLGLIVGTTTSADDNATGKKPSFTTDEINFHDYFVPSQHLPEAAASGDALVVNEERMAAKGKPDEAKMKKELKNIKDGNKFQVESSQDSLSMHRPHGDVLHSDTESFRIPRSTAPQSSGTSSKQKSKSSHKRSKPCERNDLEVAASHSPSASDARKPKHSLKVAKLNENDTKAVSHHQNAEIFSASNSTFKSPTNRQPKKSKHSTTEKSSTAEARKPKSDVDRKKTLLSTNIFKDDNDGSSDDDLNVGSGSSAATDLDYISASEASEMENNAGSASPQTVGQRRRAAEVDDDSRVNEYTLEMLRKATLLEKAKRTAQMPQDSETQLDEFVPNSEADPNP